MVFRISKMSRRFISTIHMQLFLGLILFLFFLCQILFANLRLRDLWFTWKKLSKSSQVFEATIFILLVVTVKLLSLIQIFKNFSCCVILLQNVNQKPKSVTIVRLFRGKKTKKRALLPTGRRYYLTFDQSLLLASLFWSQFPKFKTATLSSSSRRANRTTSNELATGWLFCSNSLNFPSQISYELEEISLIKHPPFLLHKITLSASASKASDN